MGGPGSGPRPGQGRGARSHTGRSNPNKQGIRSAINQGPKGTKSATHFLKSSPIYGHNYVKSIRGEKTGITVVKKSVLRGNAYAYRNSSTPIHMRRMPASKRK